MANIDESHNTIIIKDIDDNVLDSVILTKNRFEELVSKFESTMTRQGYEPDVNYADSRVQLRTSIVFNNFISVQKYENVLVIPSFRNNKYTNFTDEDNNTVANITPNIFQVINEYFECSPEIFVAYPEDHTGFGKSVVKEFNGHVIRSNKMYIMGDETYEIYPPDDIEFDAVILAGIDMNEGVTFQASDIKNDFSQYCVDNFDLIDVYGDNEKALLPVLRNENMENIPERITGEKKNIDRVCNIINNNSIGHADRPDTENRVLPKLSDIIKKYIRVY